MGPFLIWLLVGVVFAKCTESPQAPAAKLGHPSDLTAHGRADSAAVFPQLTAEAPTSQHTSRWRRRRRRRWRRRGSESYPRTTCTLSSTSRSSSSPFAPLAASPRPALARVLTRPLQSLRRYSPATILTALQEVTQHAQRRSIDWRALVAKTATGITSAREYQMLWRYIAYGHDLVENVEDGSPQPLVCALGWIILSV